MLFRVFPPPQAFSLLCFVTSQHRKGSLTPAQAVHKPAATTPLTAFIFTIVIWKCQEPESSTVWGLNEQFVWATNKCFQNSGQHPAPAFSISQCMTLTDQISFTKGEKQGQEERDGGSNWIFIYLKALFPFFSASWMEDGTMKWSQKQKNEKKSVGYAGCVLR